MIRQLSDEIVESMEFQGKREEYWDETFPTFGIRIGLETKSWCVIYRNSATAPQRRKTIGRWPRLEYSDAKEMAKQFYKKIRTERL